MTERPRTSPRSTSPRAIPWGPPLLALASFAVGSLLVRGATPADTRGNIGAARQSFAEAVADVDVVFIGSSRVQAGVDVEALEAEWRAAGEDLRAFNFGVPGMRTLEQGHVLRQVLAQRSERLKWVVLEASPLGITIRRNTDYSRKAEVITGRAISWHTTKVTRRALEAIRRFPLPLDERAELASYHLGLWGRRTWNVGLLSERLLEGRQLRGPEGELVADPANPFGDVLGMTVPRKPEDAKTKRSREELDAWRTEQTAGQYDARTLKVLEQNALPVDLAELDLGLVEERVREARAAGVELVFLTLPAEVGCPEVLRLEEAGLLGPLLHFNDPERYPGLFGKDMRKGLGHLNPTGAEAFSRALAREFLRLRDGGSRNP